MSNIDPSLLLAVDEKIVANTRPHWFVCVGPLLILFAWLGFGNWWLSYPQHTKVIMWQVDFLILAMFIVNIGSSCMTFWKALKHWRNTQYVLTNQRFMFMEGANLLIVHLSPKVLLGSNRAQGSKWTSWGTVWISGAEESAISWNLSMPHSKIRLHMKGTVQAGSSMFFTWVARPREFLQSLHESQVLAPVPT
jgi:hypothetical protein